MGITDSIKKNSISVLEDTIQLTKRNFYFETLPPASLEYDLVWK